jgi:succinate dehydrogenase / fumarate reductase, cytochrome b subunit
MMQRGDRLHTFWGGKVVVALTGLGLVGFVIFHMLGNLQVFEGAEALNRYAAMLRDMPILLWFMRLGLLAIVVFHIGLAIRLALRNHRARPVAYAVRDYRRASLASRTMAVSGSLLLLFILFHLLHLTFGIVDPSFSERVDGQGHRDVYGKLVHAFQNPLFVVAYLVGQLALGFHLSHALSSSLQTLGFEHASVNRIIKAAGPIVALFVILGNVAIILAVFLGVVRG